MNTPKPWFLYLLECNNGAYYAGITTDVQRRFETHLSGRGAKFTRANPPLRILGSIQYADRSAASRSEWEIKKLPRAKKIGYIGVAV